MTQAVPSTLAVESLSWETRETSATSFSRTVPPVGRVMRVLATSSTLWNLASVLTVRVLEPFSTLPAG